MKKAILIFITILSLSSLSGQLLKEVHNKPTSKKVISLNSTKDGEWKLFFGIQDASAPQTPDELKESPLRSITATVPGNVEIDLQREGIIEDPMIGDNVYDLRKYESYYWWYVREFDAPDLKTGESLELAFDGIDCIADIWLNGRLIASVENMFVEHHYDITELLEDQNVLHVHIKSTVLEAREYFRNNFGVRYDQLGEAVSIRKAPHMFGWDIMPRLISAGIWRDVKLEIIPPTYFSSVYWVTREVYPDGNRANMYVDWQFMTDRLNVDDLTLTFELERNGKYILQREIHVTTTISRERIRGLEDVDLWWPRGFGEPARYNAILTLKDPDGKVLCENRQRIGIRNARLILTPINTKEKPGDFHFEVNGEYIFVKGTNWVPLDALHSRDVQHVDKAVKMLADLNCNMIRMWGGNVYESNCFYNLCDEKGIMVWQDFTFGCTTYPQDAAFREKVKDEAEKVVRRLRNHPSIVLWAGNNENDVSLQWANDQSHINPNTDVISREVLPMAVREWDPKTPYLPSSPFISEEVFAVSKRIRPELSPEMHLWGPRGYYKAPFYTENNAKFVSEIGYHGCPNIESLEKMMTPGYVYPWTRGTEELTDAGKIKKPEALVWNDEWQCKATRSHPNSSTNKERNLLMVNQIREVFGECPAELEDFVTASQIVQAEAKKYFIEFWRINKGNRNGILWWNLRDGWPIISDAIVDYYGGKKLAYHYIKKVQTDVCVMVGDARDGGHPVMLVNDTREAKKVRVLIKDKDSGKVLLNDSFEIESNGISKLDDLPRVSDNQLWLIEYEVDGKRYSNHYAAYQPPMQLEQYKEWLQFLNVVRL
ncbi:MAG: glycoside hydrolase family 2 [Bacteroidales bacterium]|nr:glycoside hydrolase family 2 [Bacteroidales bacterium]